MASIKLTGDTSGVITVSAPASAGTNTLTLPAATGTVALTANITTAVPSQTGNSGKYLTTNGSASSWGTVAVGGVTHLGTMTTTGGTSQTIDELDFTDLNLLIFIVAQVSHSDGTSRKLSIGIAGGANLAIGDAVTAGNCSIGQYTFDLRSNIGHFAQSPGNAPITSGSNFVGGGTGHSRYLIGTNLRASSSTSVTVAFEGGVTFDNGKVEVYGLK
jgi:hypothetical protein